MSVRGRHCWVEGIRRADVEDDGAVVMYRARVMGWDG